MASCGGFSMDGQEDHLLKDCKCEVFGDLSNKFYIESKRGWVQACARTQDSILKWGFIIDNNACDPFLPFIYDGAKSFTNGLAPVMLNNKWGAIDSSGKLVIDYKYQLLETFSDSLAAFQDGNLWGFINSRADTLVVAKYSNVSSFWANLSLVNNHKGWRVINSKGKVLPIRIDSLIDNYYSGTFLAISRSGYYQDGISYEVIEYPFYSAGKKVKLFSYRNKYAILPDTGNVNFKDIEKTLPGSIFSPIFE